MQLVSTNILSRDVNLAEISDPARKFFCSTRLESVLQNVYQCYQMCKNVLLNFKIKFEKAWLIFRF